MKLRLLLVCIFCSVINAHATRYYVNAAATGSGIGTSWANAFTSLQTALSAAIFGDEIWVAAGQYYPTTSSTRTSSFVLKDGVDVYGGFSGDEATMEQRDVADNPTTLNGDIGEVGEISDNSHNVIRCSNLTTTVALDGFRIINGNSGASYGGGAIRVSNSLNGVLLIKNCYFFSNRAVNYGGAIYMTNSNVTVRDSEFRGSYAGTKGGAIYILNNGDRSTLEVTGCNFIGNSAVSAAVLANVDTSTLITIDRCLITNNTSPDSIIDIDHFITAKIYNTAIIGNSVNGFSSNILMVSHYANNNEDDFEMVNCTVSHNYNRYVNTITQEIIDLYKSKYKVKNCIVYGNTAYQGRQLQLNRAVSNSLVQGGYSNNSGNIDGDPMFIAPNSTGTTNFDASQFNYQLAEGSPSVNAGNNAFVSELYPYDLNGSNRIAVNTVDQGAYESPFDPTAGTNDVKNNQFSVYPNPFTNRVFVTTGSLPDAVALYDINGAQVAIPAYHSNSNMVEVNLSNVTNRGVYILKLMFKDKVIYKKVIKG